MKPYAERLYNGIVKENPVFVLMLGMCPTLAVTTSAINGLGMGLSSLVVLAISNLVISLLRNIIPDDVRLPAFIVIVASFVTVVELLMEAYMQSLYIGMTVLADGNPIGTIREVLGNGSFFGIAIPGYEPMAYFVRAPGAFLVLAILVAIMNASGIKNRANKMTEGCDGCCASCSSSCDKKEG